MVDWSWDLLAPAEQVLARRLAVFPAGATLAAAEQVCGDQLLRSAEVLPALSGLVDKSFVAAGENPEVLYGPGPRYRMLETVRAYALERLAAAGEQDRVRDAFAAHYLNLAETADPRLRAAGQGRWLRELAAEQDNLHAALRWMVARRDGDTALRFVRALGWYWMLRGQPGEPEALARDVLELQPRERSPLIAEARMVCALTASGPSWEIDTAQPALASAVADFAEWAHGEPPSNPIAAMAEPMLAVFDRSPERAFAVFDRYTTSPDPWVRAVVPLLRCTFGNILGRMDRAESDCQRSLAEFRALGEAWGAAAALIQIAELAQFRADYATAVAALEEAAAFGRELGAWGDLSHIDGKLAAIRLRMGDLERARADLERAEHAESERSAGPSDVGAWLTLVRAELNCREGDMRTAALNCEKVLAWLDKKQSQWWDGMRAVLQARLALVVLQGGDEARCRGLLATALQAAAGWVELPALAAVIDAIAVLALRPDGPSGPREAQVPRESADPGESASPGARPARPREDAALAATLLGASHSIRGRFDEGSLDAPGARDAARRVLGPAEFETAYGRGRALGRDDALTLASGVIAGQAAAGLPRIRARLQQGRRPGRAAGQHGCQPRQACRGAGLGDDQGRGQRAVPEPGRGPEL